MTIETKYNIGDEVLAGMGLHRMQPVKIKGIYISIESSGYWIIEYADIAFGTQARLCKEELIDALFAEIVILKEEGVI